MSFNPDPSKQVQEVIFSRKVQNTCHCSIYFNNKLVKQEHLKRILNKVNKTIGLLRTLQNILPRGPLLTICKSFVRAHLDYDDVIYDQQYNNSFHQKLEPIQFNAALAIRGSSWEKLYQVLDLESLKQGRWYRKLCYLFKITKNLSISLMKSPPLGQYTKQEIISETLLGSMSIILFFKNSEFYKEF